MTQCLRIQAFLFCLVTLLFPAYAQVLPRQTGVPFQNGTANSTTTSGDSAGTASGPWTAITPPPTPCCWVIAGTQAVGLERWWNTSAAEVIATVISNIGRYNGSTTLLNATTIYKPNNATFTDYGFYGQSSFVDGFAFTSPVSIPATILDDNLVDPGDYAGTSIVSGSVQTWNYTDLRV